LFGLELQEAVAGLTSIPFGVQFDELIRQQLVFVFALNLLGRSSVHLRAQSVDAFADLVDLDFDTSEHCRGRAVTLFEARDAGYVQRSVLGGEIAALLERGKALEATENLAFEGCALIISDGDFGIAGNDAVFLFAAFGGKACKLGSADFDTLADAGHLGIKLLEHVAGCHRMLFGVTPLGFEAVKEGGEFLDFTAKQEHARFAVAQSAF
jgi:hypothetical protein